MQKMQDAQVKKITGLVIHYNHVFHHCCSSLALNTVKHLIFAASKFGDFKRLDILV